MIKNNFVLNNMQEIKAKFQYPYKKSAVKYTADPNRTIEWVGGVNYTNLEKAFGELKILLAEDKETPITMYVNSYGGPTGIALGFYDAVRSWMKASLVTIGSGDVDSSGIIVFLSGKRRYLTKNTSLLLHLAGRNFNSEQRFTVREMDSMLKEDKLKDYQYACVVADATGGKLTPDRVLEMMANNTILTAEEAVNYGLAHKIL